MRFFKRFSRLLPSSIWILAGLFILGFGLYANTLANAVVWDDRHFLFAQPFLKQCGNFWTVLNPRNFIWVLPVENGARPVWLASVLLDTCVYGGAALGYRVTSILLHVCGGILLLLMVWHLTRDRRMAVVSAVIFLVHPVHTESVNIITFRTDILAFDFMLLAVLMYLRGRDDAGRRGALWLIGSAGGLFLALLAKEMAVTFLVLVLLIDALFPAKARRAVRRIRRRRYAACGAYLALSILYIGFRIPRSGYMTPGHADLFTAWRARTNWLRTPALDLRDALSGGAAAPRRMFRKELSFAALKPGVWLPAGFNQGAVDPPAWEPVYEDPGLRLRTMIRIFGSYLRLLAWPYPLQGDYAPRGVRSWLDGGLLASLAAWCALLVLGWRLRRRRPIIALGIFWILVTLLPVSGLIMILNPQAERYLYIPSAGASLCLAAVLVEFSRRRAGRAFPAAAAAGALWVAGFGAWTIIRNRDYRDEMAFHSATLRVDPGVARAHFVVAGLQRDAGRWKAAEASYRETLRLWPAFVSGRNVFARFLLGRGRVKDAIVELEAARDSRPDLAGTRFNLGQAYWALNRREAALGEFRRALELRSDCYPAALAVGGILLRRGRASESIPYLERALTILGEGSVEALYPLGRAYRLAGRRRELKRILKRLEGIDPDLAQRLRFNKTDKGLLP